MFGSDWDCALYVLGAIPRAKVLHWDDADFTLVTIGASILGCRDRAR